MTFVDKTLDEMLKEIGFNEFGTYDIIIPEENGRVVAGTEVDLTYKQHKILEDIAKQMDNHYAYYVIGELILNGLCRGNKKQSYLPISIKIFEGDKGIVIRIRDSGEGFNFKEKIRQMKNGETYYQYTGGGLRLSDKVSDEVSYEGNGSIVNVCILNREEGWKKYLTKKE